MKTNFRKIFIVGMIAVNVLGSINVVHAAEEVINLPVISKPQSLNEGTQRVLTASQLEELLPWAKDSKVFLQDLLDNIAPLKIADQVERLRSGIEEVVLDSKSAKSELFMRYVLNRALVLSDTLKAEVDNNSIGYLDIQRNLLKTSIDNAIKYYDQEFKQDQKNAKIPFIKFGIEYFNFLNELNKSVLDSSAQYQIQRTALEWLQWDLYRDLNNKLFASQIVKINNSLKTFPAKKTLSDVQYLNFVRQLKTVSFQLKLIEKIGEVDLALKQELEEKEINEKRAQGQKQLDLTKQKFNAVIGQKVAFGDDAKEYTLIGISKGKFVLKNDNGVVVTTDDFNRIGFLTGCADFGACVNEELINTLRDNIPVSVKAIYPDGKVALLFLEGEVKGKVGIGWAKENLAKKRGEASGFKIGDKVINIKNNGTAIIHAITYDGKFVLKYYGALFNNEIGGNWESSFLIKDIN